MYKYADDKSNKKIDSKLIPYLKRLNNVVGVATIQSCVGHKVEDGYEDGYLWLRLSEKIRNIVYDKVYSLVNIDGVIKISIIYHSSGEELFEINFQSVETSEGRKAIEKVVIFFELLKCY